MECLPFNLTELLVQLLNQPEKHSESSDLHQGSFLSYDANKQTHKYNSLGEGNQENKNKNLMRASQHHVRP